MENTLKAFAKNIRMVRPKNELDGAMKAIQDEQVNQR